MLTDEQLLARTRLILIDENWARFEDEMTKGNRRKFLALPLDSSVQPIPGMPLVGADVLPTPVPRPWFWKASLSRYPLEFWSEVMAYQLAVVMGVDVPICLPSLYEGTYGSLSYLFVNRFAREVLAHGGDFFSVLSPGYDRKKGREHSVQLIQRALIHGSLEHHFDRLFEHFVFDGLIGNGDRHQDNWGIVFGYTDGDYSEWPNSLAPAFDNGTSLGRELLESAVERMLSDSVKFESYVNHGRVHVRWESNGELHPVRHEELISRIIGESPHLRDSAHRILSFDLDRAQNAIHRIGALSESCAGVEISEARQELIIRLLTRRRERLLSTL